MRTDAVLQEAGCSDHGICPPGIEPQGKLIASPASILAVWSSTILRLWTGKTEFFSELPLNPILPAGRDTGLRFGFLTAPHRSGLTRLV